MENAKVRYCKICGSVIDAGKKCTGCGKQYFRFSFSHGLLVTLLTISILALAYSSYYASIVTKNYNELSKQYDSKCKSYDTKLTDIRQLYQNTSEELESLKKINLDNVSTLRYYESIVALVTKTGTKYHKYNCSHLNNAQMLYHGLIEDLERQGYEPCLDCQY